MTTLTKHLDSGIKIDSRSRFQSIQDRKALIRSLERSRQDLIQLIYISLFMLPLMLLCLELVNNILSTNKGL